MGKALIVTDTGFYRQLPNECVLKVSIQNEIADLQRHLEYLAVNPIEISEMGKRGKIWAKKTFDSDQYREQFINFSRRVLMAKPITQASQHFSNILQRWGKKSDIEPFMDSIISPLRIFEIDKPMSSL